jgi:tRNA1(Val) A37 N6-methylase TrmN6
MNSLDDCDINILNIDDIVNKAESFSLDLIKKLNLSSETSINEKNDMAEHSTPSELLITMANNIDKECFINHLTFLDYSCGKGNIILIIFYYYYINLVDHVKNKKNLCLIISKNIYFADINQHNIYITSYKLNRLCQLICDDPDIDFTFNCYTGNSLKMDVLKIWNISHFDIVFVNPPFEDRNNRKKTPHKLWIDFTLKTFNEWLKPNGYLYQISPDSFSSPSSKILKLFREKNVQQLHFNQGGHFKNVAVSIAWYIVQNSTENLNNTTNVNNLFNIKINDELIYIPNDNNPISLSIHKKIMFDTKDKYVIAKDYVTCHNIRLKDENSVLSKTKTDKHIYPIFHTNKQVWYSSVKQEYMDKKKVMWTRSGYTKPFYDKGIYGYTDLAYFILVDSDLQGENINHNLNSELFKYIFKTARWSGFGNDKVFYALPKLPDKKMNDIELFDYFKLTDEERLYVL